MLGIYGGTVTPAVAGAIGGLRDAQGVVVLARTGVGLSGQSSLTAGDVVHAVNGKPVDSVESFARRRWTSVADSMTIVLQVERGGMYSFQTVGAEPLPGARTKKTGPGRSTASAALQY